MSNRNLTTEELAKANELLNDIRQRLAMLAGNDRKLLFAFRRKVYKELTYDERGKPGHRKRLKTVKRVDQGNVCLICGQSLPEKYVVLDRLEAADGYTAENIRLIHPKCDANVQESRGYV